MPAFAAPIEVIQAALHRIGEEELPSLDGDDSAARVANSNYEGIVRAVFARHAWTFAKRTFDLTYQGVVQLGPYSHAWVWPSEVANIRYVLASGQKLRSGDYSIEGDRLLTGARFNQLQIVATIRAPESAWPGDVTEAIVTRLQALFLEALCDKPQDARLKERDADQKLRDAIVRDKRQEPGVVATGAPLAEVWRGRGRYAPGLSQTPVQTEVVFVPGVAPPAPPAVEPVPFDFASIISGG